MAIFLFTALTINNQPVENRRQLVGALVSAKARAAAGKALPPQHGSQKTEGGRHKPVHRMPYGKARKRPAKGQGGS